MRYANLNIFFPVLALAEVAVAGPVTRYLDWLMSLSRLLMGLYGDWIARVPQVLVFIAIVIYSLKTDLSPLTRNPEKEGRYRTGHWLIGLATAAMALSFIAPITLAIVLKNEALVFLSIVAIPVIGIGFLLWGGGLYLVFSARASGIAAA